MSSSDTYTILLVDDEPEVRASARRSLNVPGYTIMEAGDAKEAMLALRTRRFDAIVSDYHMPGCDGLELLQRIRILYPHMLRVLLTGRADVELAVRALNEGGCHRLFLKPWSAYDLRGILRLALHVHLKSTDEPTEQELHGNDTVRTTLDELAGRGEPGEETTSIARATLQRLMGGSS
jgi:DNA-binding NtrC family response regulator